MRATEVVLSATEIYPEIETEIIQIPSSSSSSTSSSTSSTSTSSSTTSSSSTSTSTSTPVDSSEAKMKGEILRTQGFQVKEEFRLTLKEPWDRRIVPFARLAFLNTEELYFFDPQAPLGQISQRNELQVLVATKRALKRLQKLSENQEEEKQNILKLSLEKISEKCREFNEKEQVQLAFDVAVPDSSAGITSLLDFVDSKGAKHDKLSICQFPQTTGRGIAAASDIEQGDVIVEIPEELLFNAAKAYSSEKVGKIFAEIEGLEDDSVLLLFLIYERFVNPDSKWKGYFASLPERFSTALDFNVGELLELDGTTLMEETIQVKEHIRLTQEMFFPELSNYYPEVFVASAFTYENFLWARGLFDSRAINMKIGGVVKTCLVPFVDMINHSLHAGVPAGTFDDESKTFKLTANSPYSKGSQVFLHYGPLKNWQLLLYYGFLVPSNPYDSMSLYFELPEDDLSDAKSDLLEKLDLSREHFVRASTLSPKSLATLRVCVADEAELEQMNTGSADPRKGMINRRNEEEALNAFASTIEALISERAASPGDGHDEEGSSDEVAEDDGEEEEEEESEEPTQKTLLARQFKESEVALLNSALVLVQQRLHEL